MAGIFGVTNQYKCAKELFYGTDYHSHLNSDWAGVAITMPDGKIFRKRKQIKTTQFKAEFSGIKKIDGKYGIGTMASEKQPFCEKSKLGNFALATDSTVLNLDDIVTALFEKGATFSESSFEQTNHTEVISKLIHQKGTVLEGIEYAMKTVNGCCTLVLLNKEGIYAARDPNGLTSLVLGKSIKDGSYAVASETCSFPNLGIAIERFLAPGEIIFFNEKECKTLSILEGSKLKTCIFNWIYFSDPASAHEGISVEEARYNCGAAIASRDNIIADWVCGVADSGTAHAIGYANKSGIPFGRALTKYTAGWARSYMPSAKTQRDEVAYFKQNPIAALITGKRLVIVDDSLRRGTQMRNLIMLKLLPYEPKEVHVRFASPPQFYACRRTPADVNALAARRAVYAIEGTKDITDFSEYLDYSSDKYKKLTEHIAKEIGATSVGFISLEDMCKAVGLPQENYCLNCWTGKF